MYSIVRPPIRSRSRMSSCILRSRSLANPSANRSPSRDKMHQVPGRFGGLRPIREKGLYCWGRPFCGWTMRHPPMGGLRAVWALKLTLRIIQHGASKNNRFRRCRSNKFGKTRLMYSNTLAALLRARVFGCDPMPIGIGDTYGGVSQRHRS